MKLTVSQLCVDEDDGGDEDSPHLWFEMRAGTDDKHIDFIWWTSVIIDFIKSYWLNYWSLYKTDTWLLWRLTYLIWSFWSLISMLLISVDMNRCANVIDDDDDDDDQ